MVAPSPFDTLGLGRISGNYLDRKGHSRAYGDLPTFPPGTRPLLNNKKTKSGDT